MPGRDQREEARLRAILDRAAAEQRRRDAEHRRRQAEIDRQLRQQQAGR